MGKLPHWMKEKKLSDLIIPGSHDSGAWYLDVNGPLAPDQPSTYQFLKKTVHKWSVTQDLDFVKQLQSGVRYFDIRIAPHPSEGSLHIVHGLYGKEISEQLRKINDFLTEHPLEVVILDFNHLLGFEKTDHSNLLNMIMHCFNSKLAKRHENLQNLSLNYLNDNNLQVVVFYNHPNTCNFVWENHWINSPWPNVQDTPSLFNFLQTALTLTHSTFIVSQGVLTPNISTILLHFRSTLKSWESNVEKDVLHWIQNLLHRYMRNLNIIIVDFITPTFCEHIIKYNQICL